MSIAHRAAGAVLMVGVLTAAGAGLAEASRASLNGRYLPPGLALDPSNLATYPGSQGVFARGLLFDHLRGFGDEFALVQGGGGVRLGYALDANTHNVFVASPSGWGVTLSFTDHYTKSEILSTDSDTTPSTSGGSGEVSERTFRLGVGALFGDPGGRVLELSLAGRLIQSRGVEESYYRTPDTFREGFLRWDAPHGNGVDVAVRTLSPRPGLLAAFLYTYADLHPDLSPSVPLTTWRRSASLDLGWRLRPRDLDDLVVGVSASWSDRYIPGLSSYPSNGEVVYSDDRSIAYSGHVFASGEKRVNERLTVRAGVSGPATFSTSESHDRTFTAEESATRDSATSNGSVGNPSVALGAEYLWRSFDFNAQIGADLDAWEPITRWSVATDF